MSNSPADDGTVRIVVLDGYTLNPGDNPWSDVEALGEVTVYDRTAHDQIVPRAAGADILLTNKTPLDAGTLHQLPGLSFISVLATGYNIVDVVTARDLQVPVSNVPEYGTDSVAQHVLAAMLHFARHCALHDALVRDGEWQKREDFCFWDTPLVELTGKRVGIIGFGRIGRRVGLLAHALGMEVIAHDVQQTNPPDYQPFAWASVDEVFATADFVTLHCPQTADNVEMVDQRLLGLMKRNAVLINSARGSLVNEQDLADALNDDRIAGAALDVLSAEPPPADHPLLHARNCLITPHIAWATLEARRRMMAVTVQNIRAFLAGKPVHVVNGL